MKKIQLLMVTILACLFLSGLANAATVMTDEQISELTTVAEAGGNVTQLAEDLLAGVTAELIAQGLTGEELSSQIAIAIQELSTGIPTDMPSFETVVAAIVQGGTAGAVVGVNQAVGADPNLDAATLTSSVTTGAAAAVTIIVAANPTIVTETLVAAVNQGAESQGAAPPEPEAFEPADTPADDPADTPADDPAPTTPPVADAPEAPPTQDDQNASPV